MIRFALGALLVTLSATTAHAGAGAGTSTHAVEPGGSATDRPRGTYVVRPHAGPRFGPGPQHRIIYMHRHGGTVYAGGDDSATNTSSIPYGTSNVTPWELGDARWNELMACTREMFSRFDVEITDVDPGAVPHIESWVSGYPQDVGWGSGVGGVSPMNEDCSVVETAIEFTFAGVYGDDVQAICETNAQETSHALGLDHEHLCQDPMTYLYGCGAKTFQDADIPCGEYSARSCMCGGSTQNSVQVLLAVLGAADANAPDIAITAPQDNGEVPQGFAITSDASDDKGVTKVDLWLDGAFVETDAAAPYEFTAPGMLAEGGHTVEVRAYDAAGNVSTAAVTARIKTTPTTPPGGLGDPCVESAECGSGVCVSTGVEGFCSASCSVTGADSCPCGYACQSFGAGGGGVCFPSDDDPTDPDGSGGGNASGGCHVGGGGDAGGRVGGGGAMLLLLAGLGLVVIRERRR